MRSLAIISAGALVALGTAAAQETSKNDPVAEQLRRSKDIYASVQEKARETLIKELDKQYENIKKNKTLKFEALRDQLGRIEDDRRTLMDSGTLPDESRGMKSIDAAVKAYVKTMNNARERCLSEYKKAVSRYREKGDIARATAVQEEMTAFLRRTSGRSAQPIKEGVLLSTAEMDPPRTWFYTTIKPGPGWNAPRFDTTGWAQGQAAFGRPPAPNLRIRTLWDTPAIWLRTWVEVPELSPNHILMLRLRHDEGVRIYVNGELLFLNDGWNNEYTELILNDTQKALFRPGRNTIAVSCVNVVGYGGIDMGLRLVLKK